MDETTEPAPDGPYAELLHAMHDCYEALKPLEKEMQIRVVKAVAILLDIDLP